MAEELAAPNDLNIDIDAVSTSMASDLGLGDESPDDDSATPNPTEGKDAESKVASPSPEKKEEEAAAAEAAKTVVVPKKAPSTWSPELHPFWDKLDPKVQETVLKREEDFHKGIEQYKGDAGFAKTIRDTLAPYQALMTAQQVDAQGAIKGLLNAHYQLSMTDEATRTGFMANLLKQYKIDPAKLAEAYGNEEKFVDPAVAALQKQVSDLTSNVTAQQTQELEARRSRVLAEVNAFASDPAHPYFAEVADDITIYMANTQLSLQEAYDRAVRANPTTWAKEEARLRQAVEADIAKKAKEDAERARRARGTNIRGDSTEKASAEQVGSMDDTLKETFASIAARTS